MAMTLNTKILRARVKRAEAAELSAQKRLDAFEAQFNLAEDERDEASRRARQARINLNEFVALTEVMKKRAKDANYISGSSSFDDEDDE